MINTIVHRDYNYSGSTLVSIFDDRIEIVSIGGLVKGITLTDIMHGISQSRNTILAAIFYRLELIESYGTGIQRIIESYANCPIKPTFMPGPSSFLVTLPNIHTIPTLQADVNLSDEEKVILLLQERGTISRSDIEQFLQCSSFPASKILQSLLTHGQIIRIGSARATKYRLKAAAEQPVD